MSTSDSSDRPSIYPEVLRLVLQILSDMCRAERHGRGSPVFDRSDQRKPAAFYALDSFADCIHNEGAAHAASVRIG